MKNICLTTALVAMLASCSAEDIAVTQCGDSAGEAYQRRTDIMMAMDFTTLFSYDNPEEAKHSLPIAFSKVIENARHRISINKGCTEAVIKVVLEDAKGKLWAQHLLDLPNKKMVESICKKEDSHHLYIIPKDKYPSLYADVINALAGDYQNLGSYGKPATNSALNN